MAIRAPNSSPENLVKYVMPSEAPSTASTQHSKAVHMHTQAAQGRNSAAPSPGAVLANAYMKPYMMTIGSATPMMSRG